MSTSNSGYLSPDEITNKSFDSKRRGGFDPDAVKRHLSSAAATVHGLTAERDALADQVVRLQDQLQNAEAHPVPQAELDEDALTERLGQDAARVLAEARAAAADRIAEAESQADDIRAAAEEVYAERSVLADSEADKIRASAEQLRAERLEEAERAAAQIIARAESDAEALRAGVAGERQSADADASRIVREAELTRRQILEDLARRRSAARRQIEQLRAGRERLLASHETVRRALDDISQELTISMSEARAAAETAGHSVSDTTIEELEAEIETARLTGLLDTGPVPVVSTPKRPSTVGTSRPYTEEDTEEETAVDDATTDAGSPGETTSSDEPAAQDAPATDAPAKDAAAPEVAEAAAPAQDIGRSAEADDSDDGSGGTSSSSGAGLADVVQLDLARNDVDTATHPATGRDASSGRGNPAMPEETPGEASTEGSSDSKPPLLEAVDASEATESDEATESNTTTEPETDKIADEEIDDLMDDEDSVGDLFASLRSTPPPAAKKPKAAAKKSSTKSTAKKSTAKKSTAKKTSSKSTAQSAEVDVDSTDVARRLKRVLADEQSRAMSQIKSANEMPSLDELLGAPAAHIEGYWVEIVAQLDDVVSDDEQLRRPVDELVESIRRRVDDALTEAGDDSEGAVSSLRSVYRELKTQRIAVCADEVCRMAAGRSADRS
ncbi:MAG: DivIVA domain-containing protein [Acidimicrobiia bacterium]|nr:DivIVA domain-containing protein [Acidimicrobiia bacterium]